MYSVIILFLEEAYLLPKYYGLDGWDVQSEERLPVPFIRLITSHLWKL